MKYSYLLLTFLLIYFSTQSQPERPHTQFGDVTLRDFEPTAYSIDSSAAAVYLFNAGYTSFVKNSENGFDVQYTHFARLRLLKKGGFEKAAVLEIPLIISKYYEQKLIKFAAMTYNMVNGKIENAFFDKINLIEESALKVKRGRVKVLKFPFPGVQEGSIIEYSYTLQLPGIYEVPSWHFQTLYPCLRSEYQITQPEYFTYLITKRGNLRFNVDSVGNTTANFGARADDGSFYSVSGIMKVSTEMLYHFWAINNVPVLKEEPYLSDLSNYAMGFDFDLFAIQYPGRLPKRVIKNWTDEISDLISDEDFGESVNHPGNWLNDPLKTILKDESSNTEKAKKIFYYVRDNFICNEHSGKYLSQPLKQVYQKKEGSIADLNLLLTALYVKAGYISRPVILSTRDNGVPGISYPSTDNYNYVISLLQTGSEEILLDASDKLLAFGTLKPKCYNGSAKVVDAACSSIMLSTDSLVENNQETAIIFNADSNQQGSLASTLGTTESFYFRKNASGVKQADLLAEQRKKYSRPIQVTNITIDSLNNSASPIRINCDLKLSLGDDDVVYFDPMLSVGIKENPFKSADRLYPVEMPYCLNDIYILNMEIPKGYTIDEIPQSARMDLEEHRGFFEYLIDKTQAGIRLRCTLKLNKANFSPDSYKPLRDFYAFIVKKEAEQIVFKKIK